MIRWERPGRTLSPSRRGRWVSEGPFASLNLGGSATIRRGAENRRPPASVGLDASRLASTGNATPAVRGDRGRASRRRALDGRAGCRCSPARLPADRGRGRASRRSPSARGWRGSPRVVEAASRTRRRRTPSWARRSVRAARWPRSRVRPDLTRRDPRPGSGEGRSGARRRAGRPLDAVLAATRSSSPPRTAVRGVQGVLGAVAG